MARFRDLASMLKRAADVRQMRGKLRLSLANKCQLLFGAAVVLIMIATLSVAWLRMNKLVREGQLQRAREIARAYLTEKIQLGGPMVASDDPTAIPEPEVMSISLLEREEWEGILHDERDGFLAEAARQFMAHADERELFIEVKREDRHYYRYARAIRKSDEARLSLFGSPDVGAASVSDPLRKILVLQFRADAADRQLLINRIYIIAAGLLGGLLAIGVFWFITTRLILSPVRVLRDTTEKISEGDLNIRSEINTGDEFEQLSDMFNVMLESLRRNEEELRAANKSLDLRLGELAETNVTLYEANKIKTEFLANVSHELRTPLNSIMGFAEVLAETLPAEGTPADEKRQRYARNIVTSSRQLLDLIEDLLDLAKIEAGRMDLNVAPVSIADTCEGLVTLIRPQADKRDVAMQVRIDPGIPLVYTDAGKLQQILFNFLSNAIKFSPEGQTVTLRAEWISAEKRPGAMGKATESSGSESDRATTGDEAKADDEATGAPPASRGSVRISVTDRGPGIAMEDHDRIFEKFTQLDPSTTREHGGTGLGLTISRDLARLLQGEIMLDSDRGQGATFSLTIPHRLQEKQVSLMPDLTGR